jgi:hypothetical protein
LFLRSDMVGGEAAAATGVLEVEVGCLEQRSENKMPSWWRTRC